MANKKVEYIGKYNKENYKTFLLRIRKEENEILDKLESVLNKNGYITGLILDDIKPEILTIKQIKEKIKPVIEKYHFNDVYLFGSYARGEATRDSDVDIYCDKGDADTLFKMSSLKEELENALNKNVDIVTIGSQMHDYFRQQLEEDMIKIC
ncbi:MAG: nucleotidyltransferase domain-containing protein [Gammaproteobacteria bacterium]|nr:nucleotidyltransferase domain-containing protein [Gammaproteobacteria bacterium]